MIRLSLLAAVLMVSTAHAEQLAVLHPPGFDVLSGVGPRQPFVMFVKPNNAPGYPPAPWPSQAAPYPTKWHVPIMCVRKDGTLCQRSYEVPAGSILPQWEKGAMNEPTVGEWVWSTARQRRER